MEDQTTSGTPGQAPGWDADPYGRHELRYWDGAEWTDHVSDRGVASHDPPDRMSPWAAMATVGPAPSDATAPETATAPRPEPTTPAAPTSSAPAPATAPAPGRPAGPSWAWDAPATLTAGAVATAPAPAATPVPPTAPSGPAPTAPAGPAGPAAPAAPAVGGYLDIPSSPKPRGRVRWVALGAVALVVIVAGFWFIRRPPDRIDAGPPAATPAGFRVVSTPDYRLAVPSAWRSQVITDADREQLGNQLDRVAPGAKDAFDQAEQNIDGTMVLVADPGTRENVNVVPFHALRGDPSQADTIEEIRGEVEDQSLGAAVSGMTTAPTDVHGFPAAALSYTVRIGAVTVSQVSTVIQTGDHVFQVTVTAASPERAAELSRQMVPTFDPA